MSEDLQCTLSESRDLAETTMLPSKSRGIYEKNYAQFEIWRKENNVSKCSENVLLAYFDELQRQEYKSSSLLCLYSQLRSCLKIYQNVDISNYRKLQAFLKQSSKGYTPKKSNILEECDINKFITEADDKIYLAMKVILIMGFGGALRREELTHMSTDDITYKGDCITVSISKTKRKFIITEETWITLVKKYADLRPKNTNHKRFFLTYRNGRCVKNPIGINTMGKVSKEIATFLRLPQPELYTGHCFKRSSTVAEGYVEVILEKKIKVSHTLGSQPQHTDQNLPTSSNISNHPHIELDMPSCSIISDDNSRTNIAGMGNNTIQHNIINNENIPNVTINAKDSSHVTYNIYNNCIFYGRDA